MSEKLFRFLVSELKAIRIVCQDVRCGAVTELKIDKAGNVLNRPVCCVCNAEFFSMAPGHDPADNPLARLSKAIHALQLQPGKVQVEFTLPDAS